jgi:outer membrane receptor protein involved in Fe transport
MLLGFPSVTGGARLDNQQHLRTRSYYLFLQDSWRLRPDLSLSLGIRYEYNAPPFDAEDRANVFDAASGGSCRSG